jgi:hypothetical protein
VGFLDIFKDLFSPKKKKKSADGGDNPAAKGKAAAKAKAAEKVKADKKAEAAKSPKKLPRVNIEKRFDLVGRTGQGSMSKVWRARDRKLGKTVCLKVLDKVKTAKFEARFVGLKRPSEGAVLTDLRHKNIVQTFEHGLTSKGEQFSSRASA